MKHKKDYELSPEQLDDKYNPDGDGEHPEYTREDWRQAVRQEETISGYWNWVRAELYSDLNGGPEE